MTVKTKAEDILSELSGFQQFRYKLVLLKRQTNIKVNMSKMVYK